MSTTNEKYGLQQLRLVITNEKIKNSIFMTDNLGDYLNKLHAELTTDDNCIKC